MSEGTEWRAEKMTMGNRWCVGEYAPKRRTASRYIGTYLTEAEARLIAASREMQAALEGCDNFLTNHMRSFGVEPDSPDDLECAIKARAALAKSRPA